MRSLLLFVLLLGCPTTANDDDTPRQASDDDDVVADDDDSAVDDDDDDSAGDDDDATTPPPPGLPVWDDSPCEGIATHASGAFQPVIDRWASQVDENPFEAGRTVFVGSSSILRWERLLEDFSAWSPLQRGFGGSRIWDTAEHSEQVITRHNPGAVVIFAGTNDIAAGLSPADVVDGYRCVVERVGETLGEIPIGFIAITPTPARWNSWEESNAVNDAVAAYAGEWPDLHFFDTREAFLATGAPPDASLFAEDGLHLSSAGYALWAALMGPQMSSLLPPVPPPVGSFPSGSRLLLDLGPSNPEDGEPTLSPDPFGQTWNNWHAMDGESAMVPGEQLGGLLDVNGDNTGLRLVMSSQMTSNGIVNGGLLLPDSLLLGGFAVGTATEDYVWRSAGGVGAMAIEGLDPGSRYDVRLFASRDATEPRVTRYSLSGGEERVTADLQVSGAGIGGPGQPNGNIDSIAEFTGLLPDPYGRLHIDYAAAQGAFAYIGVLELEAQ